MKHVKIVNIPRLPRFYRLHSNYRHSWQDEIAYIKDMLRYDRAFVCDKHDGIVASISFKVGKETIQGKITPGRWESFGYRLEAINAKQNLGDEEIVNQWYANHHDIGWFTARHEVDGYGVSRYGTLELVSLTDWMLHLGDVS